MPKVAGKRWKEYNAHIMSTVMKTASEIANPALAENDAHAFIWKHGLGQHVETARRLIAEHFNGSAVTIERVQDQEFADEWVNLHVNLEGQMRGIVDDYEAFTRAFVPSVPQEVIGKIRLSLGIV